MRARGRGQEYSFNGHVGGLSLRGDVRKWVVAQMLWVDENSFANVLTPASFIHAATAAADDLAGCWIASFTLQKALVETVAGTAGLLYLQPIGGLMFLAIVLFAAMLHVLRGEGQRALEQGKQLRKRKPQQQLHGQGQAGAQGQRGEVPRPLADTWM